LFMRCFSITTPRAKARYIAPPSSYLIDRRRLTELDHNHSSNSAPRPGLIQQDSLNAAEDRTQNLRPFE
jgi:hypothetical protein